MEAGSYHVNYLGPAQVGRQAGRCPRVEAAVAAEIVSAPQVKIFRVQVGSREGVI
jgi:hypothetical protein